METRKDKSRNPRPYVVVGQWANDPSSPTPAGAQPLGFAPADMVAHWGVGDTSRPHVLNS